MKDIIVTIGREYGSGGRIIAEKLAKELGIPFYDKELIDMAAESSGLRTDLLIGADEVAGGMFLSPAAANRDDNMNDRLFAAQSAVIKDIAEKGSAVIVGRCADYILKDHPNIIKVFIFADLEYKIALLKERHHLKDDELIKKIILRTDKNRRTYYQYYTDCKWGERDCMDILLDTSLLGVDGSVELLKQAALIKMNS